jgi:selenocysteine-specific elongation factor
MRVIGTAGHVDHGKSTLVKALTGINPDRLKEEQEREMTIDLGFAWMTLPSGQTVSLVDVPGHEAFIKNMLAGVGGIDAGLLVIAADEGIMPQTREHLSILDLLKVRVGVVALTKTDLATEPGWLELVEAETLKTLEGTVLAGAPIVRVSAKTGVGLDALKHELDRVLGQVREKADLGRPRLPVDRVFSIAGFGTVVTGTLSDGAFAVGDEVEIAPGGLKARIRGVQTHKEKLARAEPGGRVALNLVSIGTNEITRGDTVILSGTYRPTELFDARIDWLNSAPKPLTHNQNLDLFAFASEGPARVRLLGGNEVKPGQSGWAQLVVSKPIVLAKGDRFVLRNPSPSVTVGGGQVAEPHPTARYRRGRAQVIDRLERAERGTPSELVLQQVEAKGPVQADDLAKALGMEEKTLKAALDELLGTQALIELGLGRGDLLLTRAAWAQWLERFRKVLEEYHGQFPLRAGMPREEFKSRLSIQQRVLEPALEQAERQGVLHFSPKIVWRASHQVRFDEPLGERVNGLLEQFEEAPFAPPSSDEAAAAIGREALNALIDQGRLEKISEHVLLTPRAERAMVEWVVDAIHERGQVTAAELRDHFNTSRKYAIAFLEYLDQKRVTKRVGDARVLR